jgi:16S rRNA (adenine1518-N6/adenine1519-N6)-dimethyltransferase
VNFGELAPLRAQLEAHGLAADKRLGQHFLLDLNLTRKIARLAGPLDGRVALEIGPGPGGLTRALLEAGARVVAIEKDPRFLPLLGELAQAADGALQVFGADALTSEDAALLAAHAPGLACRIVSNLPYNVGSALLVKWLTGPLRPEAMALMFQKEVAQRIAARVGETAYGRLAVIAQAVCAVRIVMDLPARAFTPPPKVDSAVVLLTPLPQRPSDGLLTALERVTAAAFGQRRKMLRSSLKPLGGEALCADCGLDASRRAEEIPVEGFLRLAAATVQTSGSNSEAASPLTPGSNA